MTDSDLSALFFPFQVLGTIFTIAMIMLWAAVSVPTIQGALSGSKRVFAAPCLSALAREDFARISGETMTKVEGEQKAEGGMDGVAEEPGR